MPAMPRARRDLENDSAPVIWPDLQSLDGTVNRRRAVEGGAFPVLRGRSLEIPRFVVARGTKFDVDGNYCGSV